MVPLDDNLRFDAFFVGRHRNRRPVRVRTRDHQHIIATKPVIPRENVAREERAADVPYVQQVVRIGPCHTDKNTVGQLEYLESEGLGELTIPALAVRL